MEPAAKTPSRSRVRTTDLTLATYLVSRGHRPKFAKQGEMESGWPIGAWLFEGGDELEGSLNTYNSGLAKVNPLEFHRKLKTVRREMYDFLEVDKHRKRKQRKEHHGVE